MTKHKIMWTLAGTAFLLLVTGSVKQRQHRIKRSEKRVERNVPSWQQFPEGRLGDDE